MRRRNLGGSGVPPYVRALSAPDTTDLPALSLRPGAGLAAIRTKIVATVGRERPLRGVGSLGDERIDYQNMISMFVNAGVDVFRLNLSHRSPDGEAEKAFLDAFRQARHEWERDGRHVALLADLQGPKIRLGAIASSTRLKTGARFRLLTRAKITGDADRATVLYEGQPFKEMSRHVAAGQSVWLGDGDALLEIDQITEDGALECTVRSGGALGSRCGVTVHGVSFDLECLTAKDKADLRWMLTHCDELAYVALSFVRTASDLLSVRRFITNHYRVLGLDPESVARRMPWLIAKIELQAALDNIDEILDVADGVMIARGDLGMQVGLEELPSIQKRLIRACNVRGKPVITATQMLDSMENSPVPKRAEVTDVYNAVFDGSDAVMLSGETSKGIYPVQAIRTMRAIAKRAERDFFARDPEERFSKLVHEAERELEGAKLRVQEKLDHAQDRFVLEFYLRVSDQLSTQDTTDKVSHAACNLSIGLPVAAVMALTTTGRTVQMVARFRPVAPVVGAAHDCHTARKLTLCFGVHPVTVSSGHRETEALFRRGCRQARQVRPLAWPDTLLKEDELVVITSGYPLHRPGTTNLVKLHRVDAGDARVPAV